MGCASEEHALQSCLVTPATQRNRGDPEEGHRQTEQPANAPGWHP